MIRRLDLRLVPAAAAVWAVTLLGLLAGWVPAAVTALAAAFPVVLMISRRSGSKAVLVVLLLAAVSATGIAIRAHDVEEHPLRRAADAGEQVVLRVELTAAPTPLRGAAFGASRAQDRSLARAELVTAETTGRRYAAGGSVVLLVPTESWRGLIAGQRLTVRGKAAPPRDGQLVVAVVPVYRAPGEVAAPPEWQRVAADMRAGLREIAGRHLGPEAAGLLPGLVVGDTSGLDPEVEQEFETAGLSHLTAVRWTFWM